MKLDPILEGLVDQASKDFDVPRELVMEVILEERLQRYRRQGGEKRFLVDKLTKLLEGSEE